MGTFWRELHTALYPQARSWQPKESLQSMADITQDRSLASLAAEAMQLAAEMPDEESVADSSNTTPRFEAKDIAAATAVIGERTIPIHTDGVAIKAAAPLPTSTSSQPPKRRFGWALLAACALGIVIVAFFVRRPADVDGEVDQPAGTQPAGTQPAATQPPPTAQSTPKAQPTPTAQPTPPDESTKPHAETTPEPKTGAEPQPSTLRPRLTAPSASASAQPAPKPVDPWDSSNFGGRR